MVEMTALSLLTGSPVGVRAAAIDSITEGEDQVKIGRLRRAEPPPARVPPVGLGPCYIACGNGRAQGGSDVGGSPEGRTRPSHDPEGCAFGKSPEKDEGKPPTREYGFALASGTRPHVATSHGLPELGLDRDAGNTWFPHSPLLKAEVGLRKIKINLPTLENQNKTKKTTRRCRLPHAWGNK